MCVWIHWKQNDNWIKRGRILTQKVIDCYFQIIRGRICLWNKRHGYKGVGLVTAELPDREDIAMICQWITGYLRMKQWYVATPKYERNLDDNLDESTSKYKKEKSLGILC